MPSDERRSRSNWSDDDALWEAMAPALAMPLRAQQAEADVRAIEAAVRLHAGASVLDVGCGAGVHANAFAARGYAVTGIDRTAKLLGIAASRATPGVTFLQADMREFARPASFDLACSLYASFGYFDDDTNRRVLANIARSLRPAGVLVLDVLGREALLAHWQAETSAEIDSTRFVARREYDAPQSILRERWTITAAGASRQFVTEQRIYSGPELAAMLRDAGFARVELRGAFDMATPYDERARRLVAFASV